MSKAFKCDRCGMLFSEHVNQCPTQAILAGTRTRVYLTMQFEYATEKDRQANFSPDMCKPCWTEIKQKIAHGWLNE